jgi:hypothetical protein
MTVQQKNTKWININSILTTLCTATILWAGSVANKLYNQIKDQPKINEVQTSAILILTKRDEEQEANLRDHNDRIIKLEAILPNKNQFQIK